MCKGYVALTFDDGPDPLYDPRLLQVFARYRDAAGQRTRGTFFLVGARAQKRPDLVRALVAAGNGVGNHSYSHPFMDELSADAANKEILGTNQILESITNQRVRVYRPPFARTTAAIGSYVRSEGMTTVLWSVDSSDWDGASATAIAEIGRRASDGDVVLLHDTHPATVAAMPVLLGRLRQRGLCPGSIVPTATPTVAWYTRSARPTVYYARAGPWPAPPARGESC
jgi:peptidoglycan/xylan/chitin deacetylase (PgdA/CDA1 family)